MIRYYKPGDRVKVLSIINVCGRKDPDNEPTQHDKVHRIGDYKEEWDSPQDFERLGVSYLRDTEGYSIEPHSYGWVYAQSDLMLAPPK